MSFEQGPYLEVAAFCERVLHEQDGVLSLIRVIDRVTHTVVGPDAPLEMEPFDYQMVLVLKLKAGEARGRHEVKIERELPSGLRETETAPSWTVHLEGGNRGADLVMNVAMRFEVEGLYWFNVYFDGELLTRMPFEVRYSRMAGRT